MNVFGIILLILTLIVMIKAYVDTIIMILGWIKKKTRKAKEEAKNVEAVD